MIVFLFAAAGVLQPPVGKDINILKNLNLCFSSLSPQIQVVFP